MSTTFIDEVLPICRILIGDDATPFTYSDNRLEDILYGTAKLLLLDVGFDTVYTISIANHTISPDPIDDPFFIPLLALKSAVIIANSEFKSASLNSGTVIDGPSTINLGGSADSLKKRLDSLQKDYNKAKLQYSVGNAIGCQAVLYDCTQLYSQCYLDRCFDFTYYNRHSHY
jgi:hypothetical protein